MDLLPPEIIGNVADLLSPADRWRLSVTCQQFRSLLPTPLRIRILSPSSNSCLGAQFYVSPAENPSHMLANEDALQFGQDYLFWTYDYARENPVFLGRHGQKLLHNEQPHFLYTLGLRPRQPDQTWKVLQGADGGTVPFESTVALNVGGKNLKPHRPDSSERLYLSAHTLTMGSLWYVIQGKWLADEELQLIRCQDYEPSEERTEKDLIVHAIPDVLDQGYYLYSPQSLKHGKAACELFHTTVKFYYWVETGMMFFHAFDDLDFVFGVPILEEDNLTESNMTSPLQALLLKNSSRWWAVKHYISTAADVAEGRGFQLQSFMETAKDHEDHTIGFDKSRDLVYIEVQDAVVDKHFPDVARDDCEPWVFLLSG